VTDTNPPVPNAAEWDEDPNSLHDSLIITMSAKEAFDGWFGNGIGDVQYQFDCNDVIPNDPDAPKPDPDLYDGDWQDSPFYTVGVGGDNDDSLTSQYEYFFKIRVRDAYGNPTEYTIETKSAIAGFEETPPEPAQTQWEIVPESTATSGNNILGIYMKAAESTDENGVQYKFHCTSHVVLSSDWQDSQEYWFDNGDLAIEDQLIEGETYTFQVQAADKSTSTNRAERSEPASVVATKTAPVDRTAPEPNPIWIISMPGNWTLTSPSVHYYTITAFEPTSEVTNSEIQYEFEATDGAAESGGWIDTNVFISYEVWMSTSSYRVRARAILRDEFGTIIWTSIPTNYSPWVPLN
jgi:hypothetical protein